MYSETHISDKIHQCRRLQLDMFLYNRMVDSGAYGIKTTCLTSSILCLTMVICRMLDDTLFMVFHAYFGIVCLVSYPLLFRKAFQFPDLIRKVKRLLTLHAMKYKGIEEEILKQKLLLRQINSIPEWGMRDGRFREFEQGTLLLYLEFVVQNLASSVITVNAL